MDDSRTPSPPLAPRVDVVIGIVLRDGQVLICQRRPDGHLGGHWEFPGGKREPGESLEQCLLRELEEELAIRVRPLEALDVIEHDYPAVRVRLHPYLCTHLDGDAKPLGCQRLQWVGPGELAHYPFPPANARLIADLVRSLTDLTVRTNHPSPTSAPSSAAPSPPLPG